MNPKPILIALCSVLIGFSFMGGCATTGQFLQTLGTPEHVQTDVAALAVVAHARITNPAVNAAVHKFANDLLQAGNLDTSQLRALVPLTHNPSADALIAAAVSFVDNAIYKLGSRNPTTTAYIRAVGNGLIAAGF